MVSIKKLTNLESSDSTFRRKIMAKRIGKFKVTNRESAISLVDGGTIGGNLSVSGTSTFGGASSTTGAATATGAGFGVCFPPIKSPKWLMILHKNSSSIYQATSSINSPRIFLFIFLPLRDLVNALLISALVASSLTANSASLSKALEDNPK